jgi:rhodanese-related sulfurtransferase
MALTPPRRIVLFGLPAAVIVGVAMLGPDDATNARVAITPDEAFERAAAQDILLIDIRRPDEWRATGVPQFGTALDMRNHDFTTQLSELSGRDFGAPIALICARGVRSARLSARLKSAGFTQIIDVPEGMLGSRVGPGWLRRGLPVKSGG